MKYKLLFISVPLYMSFIALGQINPGNVASSPTEKLKIFEPYFGKYEHTLNFGGVNYYGTMEVKPIIKGWYVDWSINTKSEDNKIDHEYHMLVTWDSVNSKYRIWRFENLHPNDKEITLRTEGNDLIIEMWLKIPNGPQIFYTRYSMPDKDQIKIVAEGQTGNGTKVIDVSVLTAKRIEY